MTAGEEDRTVDSDVDADADGDADGDADAVGWWWWQQFWEAVEDSESLFYHTPERALLRG